MRLLPVLFAALLFAPTVQARSIIAASQPAFGSPNKSYITNTTGGTITDAYNNAWTINGSGQMVLNGTALTSTSSVIEIAYVNGVVWQENTSYNWYSVTSINGSNVSFSSLTQIDPITAVAVMTTTDFINSMGVNTEITNGPANYSNISVDLQDLQYLGITHIRDNYTSTADTLYASLGQAGIKFDFEMYIGGNLTSTNLQGEFTVLEKLNAACAPLTCVTSVEGPNEISSTYPPTYNGVTTFDSVTAMQADIYADAHADTKLPGIVAYYFTNYGLNGEPVGPNPYTSTTKYADYDNAHPYPQNGLPPLEGLANTSCCVNPLRADAILNEAPPIGPTVYTETGYRNTTTASGMLGTAIGELEIYLDAALQGIAYTYIFELQEEGTAGDGTAAGLGMFAGNTNALDDTPTQAATTIHNVTTLLTSTGTPAAGATAIGYSISNLPSATGHSLEFIGGNNTSYIAIWNETGSLGTTQPTTNITVTFNRAATGTIYDPVTSGSSFQSFTNATSVNIALLGDPIILKIN